jgi:hypothetical protein
MGSTSHELDESALKDCRRVRVIVVILDSIRPANAEVVSDKTAMIVTVRLIAVDRIAAFAPRLTITVSSKALQVANPW